MERGESWKTSTEFREKLLEFASRDTTVNIALVRKILEAGLKWVAEHKLGPTEEEVREILSKRWALPTYDISGNMVESALVACNAWKKQEFLAPLDEFEQVCGDLKYPASGYTVDGLLRIAFHRGRKLDKPESV